MHVLLDTGSVFLQKELPLYELPESDISLLLVHPACDIQNGNDKSIDDAIIVLERRLQQGERWEMIIVHREKGMLLLTRGGLPGHFTGLWLKSPTCGDDSQTARMTSYMLGRAGAVPTHELHENFVSKYPSILITNPGEKTMTCEAIR